MRDEEVCSICKVKKICAFVDTDKDNAPVCRDCYEEQKEEGCCPCCGKPLE